MVGARSHKEESPRGFPGAGVSEAGGADLGAVGGGPAAGGDLPVGVPVGRVEAGEVEGGAVEGGEGRGIHSRLVDAGKGREPRDGLRRWCESEVAGGGSGAADDREELGGGEAVGVGQVLKPGLDGLIGSRRHGDGQGRVHVAGSPDGRDPQAQSSGRKSWGSLPGPSQRRATRMRLPVTRLTQQGPWSGRTLTRPRCTRPTQRPGLP